MVEVVEGGRANPGDIPAEVDFVGRNQAGIRIAGFDAFANDYAGDSVGVGIEELDDIAGIALCDFEVGVIAGVGSLKFCCLYVEHLCEQFVDGRVCCRMIILFGDDEGSAFVLKSDGGIAAFNQDLGNDGGVESLDEVAACLRGQCRAICDSIDGDCGDDHYRCNDCEYG